MAEQCDFSCEHADGSFLDHLNFCKEYAMTLYVFGRGAASPVPALHHGSRHQLLPDDHR